MVTFELARIYRPSILFLGPSLVAGFAWIVAGRPIPNTAFSKHTELTIAGMLIVAAWFGLILLAARAGESGVNLEGVSDAEQKCRLASLEKLERRLTLLALAGAAILIALLIRSVDILGTLSLQQGNRLDRAIPDSAGPQTLRYAVAPAFGVSLGVYIGSRRASRYLLINATCLFVVAVVSARILILLSFTIALAVALWIKPDLRVRVRVVLLAVLILFAVNIPLNYWRNSGFFESQGVSGPIPMAASQVQGYLAAPVQVATHVANGMAAPTTHSFRLMPSREGFEVLVVPSFLRDARDGKQDFERDLYGPDLDLRTNLTTNSSFADLTASYSISTAFLVVPIAFFMAIAGSRALRSRSPAGPISSGIVFYGFVELWRIYYWSLGLMFFLLVLATCASVGLSVPKFPSQAEQDASAHRSARSETTIDS